MNFRVMGYHMYVFCQCSALLVCYPIVVAITSVKTGLLRIAQIATTEHYMHLSTGELEFCNYQDRDKTISRTQGGRSCTGARSAPAEKFGFGRKF